MMSDLVLESVLTCPHCGFAKQETMPTDACQYFYVCTHCNALLRPLPGDCCVFCSFGSVSCPPIQAGSCCARDEPAKVSIQSQPETTSLTCSPEARDAVAKCSTMILLWVLPAALASIALVASAYHPWLILVAGAAFTLMGVACAVNGARCGRLHCFITAPWFLLLALAAVAVYLRPNYSGGFAWAWILSAFLVLSPALIWLPECHARRTYIGSSKTCC